MNHNNTIMNMDSTSITDTDTIFNESKSILTTDIQEEDSVVNSAATTTISTPTPTMITLTHMPNDVIIQILSCLPTLDMMRIRSTCRLLNECSMNGHAWRYSINRIDDEMSNDSDGYDQRRAKLFTRLKGFILTESMTHIQPKPLLHTFDTRHLYSEAHAALVCDVLEYYTCKLTNLTLDWPHSNDMHGDRCSVAISPMSNLRDLLIYARQSHHDDELKPTTAHMNIICRSRSITHLSFEVFASAHKWSTLIPALYQNDVATFTRCRIMLRQSVSIGDADASDISVVD
jgi:hypothetical protein